MARPKLSLKSKITTETYSFSIVGYQRLYKAGITGTMKKRSKKARKKAKRRAPALNEMPASATGHQLAFNQLPPGPENSMLALNQLPPVPENPMGALSYRPHEAEYRRYHELDTLIVYGKMLEDSGSEFSDVALHFSSVLPPPKRPSRNCARWAPSRPQTAALPCMSPYRSSLAILWSPWRTARPTKPCRFRSASWRAVLQTY